MKVEQPLAGYNGKPEIDDGHTKIANELLDAIVLNDFSKRQLKIILFIIRKTYGWNKSEDDISRSQIMEATGLLNPHITTALQELQSANVVIVSNGNHAKRYKINKYYDQWRITKTETITKTVSVTETETITETVTERYRNGNNSLPKQYPQKTTPKDNTKYISEFNEFWKIYPKRQGKKKSIDIWLKAKPDLNLIKKALLWQIPNWAKDKYQYAPMPTTYLNQERWNDEPVYIQNKTNGVVL